MTGMTNTWITLDTAARRKNWWWTAYLTLVCGGTTVAVTLTAESGLSWWLGGVGVFWALMTLHTLNLGYGRALLTPDRIILHTLFGSRSIPWAEITRIEKRSSQTRSSIAWDLRLVRVHGRPVAVPGTYTRKAWDDNLDRKLNLIQEYWSRSTGQ
ncbi:PH domain-containing protein [Streptomyces sp. 6-11-2]|uniref:PH domain-containing protein n=1 Tax=Streptomyces sp. 6-11-2 TaxID=2585753 RepID=UPI0011437F8F